jgi:hypothetical protein
MNRRLIVSSFGLSINRRPVDPYDGSSILILRCRSIDEPSMLILGCRSLFLGPSKRHPGAPHHPGPLLPSPSPRPGEEGEQQEQQNEAERTGIQCYWTISLPSCRQWLAFSEVEHPNQ